MKLLKRTLGVALIWLLVAGGYALQMSPETPRSLLGWALLVLLVPPLYAASEYGFSYLFSPKHGAKISPSTLSWKRLLILLGAMLLILAGAAWLSHWLGRI